MIFHLFLSYNLIQILFFIIILLFLSPPDDTNQRLTYDDL